MSNNSLINNFKFESTNYNEKMITESFELKDHSKKI